VRYCRDLFAYCRLHHVTLDVLLTAHERKRRNFPFKSETKLNCGFGGQLTSIRAAKHLLVPIGVNCLGDFKCCFLFARLKPHFCRDMKIGQVTSNASGEKIVDCSLGMSVLGWTSAAVTFDLRQPLGPRSIIYSTGWCSAVRTSSKSQSTGEKNSGKCRANLNEKASTWPGALSILREFHREGRAEVKTFHSNRAALFKRKENSAAE
jgi:hypothetical protein